MSRTKYTRPAVACPDCGKPMTGQGERCRPCAVRNRWKDFVAPVFKCVDCSKPIARYSERCQRCTAIQRWKDFSPEMKKTLGEIAGRRAWKHGGKDTPEFKVWTAMKNRCYNKNGQDYEKYGGRGIKPCEALRISFVAFFAYMGPRPGPEYSIDRHPDNNGGYTCGSCDDCKANGWKSNCRWATVSQQACNRRNNRMISFQGKTMTLSEWARSLGMPRDVLDWRFKLGWSIERAFTEPMRKMRNSRVSSGKSQE